MCGQGTIGEGLELVGLCSVLYMGARPRAACRRSRGVPASRCGLPGLASGPTLAHPGLQQLKRTTWRIWGRCLRDQHPVQHMLRRLVIPCASTRPLLELLASASSTTLHIWCTSPRCGAEALRCWFSGATGGDSQQHILQSSRAFGERHLAIAGLPGGDCGCSSGACSASSATWQCARQCGSMLPRPW